MITGSEMRPLHGMIIIPIVFILLGGCTKKTYQPNVQPQEVHGQKMMLGEVQYDDILYYFPTWQGADSESEPGPVLVDQVKKIEKPLEILCYLGTWCGDSREGVPLFMRTVEAANNKNIRVKMFGVDRKKMDPENTAIQYDIQRVPTFIIFQDRQEIGRMIEFPLKENFVEDLLDIVNAQ
jgi:thiol-disulfide isomerase/thioredoxin